MNRTPLLHIVVLSAFLANTFGPLPNARAGEVFLPAGQAGLPAPGARMATSPAFTPPMLLGLTVDQTDPLKFNFLIDQGDEKVPAQDQPEEFKRLIKYFLASLTIPEKDLWVNLSPYEGQRIIPQTFGQTEMGRDLLGQDYVLKQITASLIYPEGELGKKFWADVYKKAYEQYGTTNIPVNTFNKVWIVPDEAMVYEHDGSAFVVKSHLKVMLEEDYLALTKNQTPTSNPGRPLPASPAVNTLGSQVVRAIVLPALEKEVNEGKNFAQLRQINNALVLATWYKRALKESLLGRFYVDKSKVRGVDHADPQANQKIYQRYLEAFKKGAYNFIKEEYDPNTRQTIPRKYFSGGFEGKDYSMVVKTVRNRNEVPNADEFRRRIDRAMSDGRIINVFAEAQDEAVAAKKAPVAAALSPISLDGIRYLKGLMQNALKRVWEAKEALRLETGKKEPTGLVKKNGGELTKVSSDLDAYLQFLALTQDPFLQELRSFLISGGKDTTYAAPKILGNIVAVGNAIQRSGVVSPGQLNEIEDAYDHGQRLVKLLTDIRSKDEAMISEQEKAENSKMTILVAEDEEAIRKLVGRILEREGYQVHYATNVTEALDRVKSSPSLYNLMMTDLRMPAKGDGETLIRAVREIDKDLPIIIMSGTGGDVDINSMKQDGINILDMLAKPFLPGTLLGILNLEQHRKQMLARIQGNGSQATAETAGPVAEPRSGPSHALVPADKKAENARIRILVVDDDKDVRDLTIEMLQEGGYTVESAANGQEALDRVEQDPGHYSLVLSDWNMPRMDGPQLAKALKENGSTSKIPFILNTGNLANQISEEVRGLTADVLFKPFSAEVLYKTVDAHALKPQPDTAMNAQDLGGINLNPVNLNLRIKRDGKGVPLPLNLQDTGSLNNIEGLMPVIIKIVPATHIPALSALLGEEQGAMVSVAN